MQKNNVIGLVKVKVREWVKFYFFSFISFALQICKTWKKFGYPSFYRGLSLVQVSAPPE